jgi:ribosomal-protein-alanine N-acetyltransferase
MILETERLVLRPFTQDDEDVLFALYTDPEVMRFLGGVRTREQTRQRLAAVVAHWREYGYGIWALVEKGAGGFVGRCGLGHLHEEVGEPELAYTLGRDHWGKGLATEAAVRAVRFGFEVLRLPRVVAYARPDNAASRRVMEKLGMTFEWVCEFLGAPAVRYGLRNPHFPG